MEEEWEDKVGFTMVALINTCSYFPLGYELAITVTVAVAARN